MAKRSLTDELMGILPGCKGVTRVRNTVVGSCNGKKRVKIVRHDREVVFTVIEPDHPKRQIIADTTDVSATAWGVEKYLKKEGVDCMR